MSRRLLGVAIMTTLAVGLTGCGSGDSSSSDNTLEIWIRQAPDSDSAKTAKKLADAFTKASGVQTKVVALFDDFETKLNQQAAQKDLPDIVINDTAQLGNMVSQAGCSPSTRPRSRAATNWRRRRGRPPREPTASSTRPRSRPSRSR